MSEVDRLSNSGLYPALPIADKRSRKEGSEDAAARDRRPATSPPKPAESPDPKRPRPPKSVIDEYA